MKQKLSITIERETVAVIEQILKDNRFRNKSHLIEFAVDKFLEGAKR